MAEQRSLNSRYAQQVAGYVTHRIGRLIETVRPTPIHAQPNAYSRVLYPRVPARFYLMMTRQQGTWCAVLMSDGSLGWVPRSAIKLTPYDVVYTLPRGADPVHVTRLAMRYLGVRYRWGATTHAQAWIVRALSNTSMRRWAFSCRAVPATKPKWASLLRGSKTCVQATACTLPSKARKLTTRGSTSATVTLFTVRVREVGWILTILAIRYIGAVWWQRVAKPCSLAPHNIGQNHRATGIALHIHHRAEHVQNAVYRQNESDALQRQPHGLQHDDHRK